MGTLSIACQEESLADLSATVLSSVQLLVDLCFSTWAGDGLTGSS